MVCSDVRQKSVFVYLCFREEKGVRANTNYCPLGVDVRLCSALHHINICIPYKDYKRMLSESDSDHEISQPKKLKRGVFMYFRSRKLVEFFS